MWRLEGVCVLSVASSSVESGGSINDEETVWETTMKFLWLRALVFLWVSKIARQNQSQKNERMARPGRHAHKSS